MTSPPFSDRATFVSHQVLNPACEAVRVMHEEFGCPTRRLYEDGLARPGEVLVVSMRLARPGYLRVLAGPPKLHRANDRRIYDFARRFGYNPGAAGLLVVNTRNMALSGVFERKTVDDERDHYARFLGALAYAIGKSPPLAHFANVRRHRQVRMETC